MSARSPDGDKHKSGGDPADVLRKRMRKQRGVSASGRKPEDGMLWGSDLGTPLALERGLVEYETNTGVAVDPNDPRSAVRTMPRAQKAWAPERLSRGRNPAVSPEALQAAQRLTRDFSIIESAGLSGHDDSGVHVDAWSRTHYLEARAMARQSYERAMKAVGLRMSPVVVWCVLSKTPGPDIAPTVDAWAKSVGWGTERAVGWLAAALELLAVHYGYSKPERATIAPGRKEGDGR